MLTRTGIDLRLVVSTVLLTLMAALMLITASNAEASHRRKIEVSVSDIRYSSGDTSIIARGDTGRRYRTIDRFEACIKVEDPDDLRVRAGRIVGSYETTSARTGDTRTLAYSSSGGSRITCTKFTDLETVYGTSPSSITAHFRYLYCGRSGPVRVIVNFFSSPGPDHWKLVRDIWMVRNPNCGGSDSSDPDYCQLLGYIDPCPSA